MQRSLKLAVIAAFSIFFPLTPFSAAASAHAADDGILSRTADIDGLSLPYLTAGHGPAVVLLHGYAETSLM